MSDDPFRAIEPQPQEKARPRRGKIKVIVPVPQDALPAPVTHPTRGRSTGCWAYCDQAGRLIGYTLRFNKHGKKEFSYLTFTDGGSGTHPCWSWKAWPEPWPLFGLDKLAERPSASVLVVEGEKCCEAAKKLLPDYVSITSPGGSSAAQKADWAALKGRQVIIWPDADQPGNAYALAVARCAWAAGAESVLVANPPPGCCEGWDVANALHEGWTTERAQRFVAAARPQDQENLLTGDALQNKKQSRGSKKPGRSNEQSSSSSGGRQNLADDLVALADDFELWHDPTRQPHASIPHDNRIEHHPIGSTEFALHLQLRYFEASGKSVNSTALDQALQILSARARFGGTQYKIHRRVAHTADGIFIDLCDEGWRVIHITAQDWRVTTAPGVKFL